jgi:CRP-like cAMP-binding protein
LKNSVQCKLGSDSDSFPLRKPLQNIKCLYYLMARFLGKIVPWRNGKVNPKREQTTNEDETPPDKESLIPSSSATKPAASTTESKPQMELESNLVIVTTSKFRKYFGKILTRIMDATTWLGTAWFIFLYFCYLYNGITVAYRSCFDEWFHHSLYWLIPDLIVDVYLYIDMVFRFFQPYQDRKTMKIYTDFKSTAKRYLHPTKGAFWFNLVARVNLEWFSFIRGYSAVYRLNKILLVYNSYNELQKFEHTKKLKLKPAIRKLLQFFFIILFVCHYVTCVWYLIVRIEGEKSRKWVQSNIILDKGTSRFFKYGLGLYWSIVVMAGYGGSLPVTDIEVIFALVVSIIGVALFVVIIGTIGNLVTNLDVTATAFREKMDTITDYMKYRNLTPDLKIRVTEYYNYIWRTRKGLDETKIIRSLPEFLRADVAMYLNREIIKKVVLFQSASPNFISEIVVNLRPRVALPGSYIIRIGEPGREMFFIKKGTVKVKLESGIVVATLTEGTFFGEMALISGGLRMANIVAVSFCDLFVLDKDDFDEIMEAYPEDADAIITVSSSRAESNQSRRVSNGSRGNFSRSSSVASISQKNEEAESNNSNNTVTSSNEEQKPLLVEQSNESSDESSRITTNNEEHQQQIEVEQQQISETSIQSSSENTSNNETATITTTTITTSTQEEEETSQQQEPSDNNENNNNNNQED